MGTLNLSGARGLFDASGWLAKVGNPVAATPTGAVEEDSAGSGHPSEEKSGRDKKAGADSESSVAAAEATKFKALVPSFIPGDGNASRVRVEADGLGDAPWVGCRASSTAGIGAAAKDGGVDPGRLIGLVG
jgi:hypothetical protein